MTIKKIGRNPQAVLDGEPVDLMAALMTSLGIDNGPAKYQPSDQNRIGMERWGKDHWSTFAYVEVRIVDHRGKLSHDHMRCHSHHPAMLSAKRAVSAASGCGDAYPSLLRDGETAAHHDDYDCIDDMIAVGLIEVTMPEPPAATLITGLVEQEMMTRAVYRLTERGQAVAAQLRQHKGAGGKWSTFVPVEVTA